MITIQRSRTNIIIIIAVVALLIAGGLAFYFFKQYSDLRSNPNAVSQETTQRLVDKIGKLYQLPKDEQPTVAEVNDRDKLKEQAFFANAENGDSLMIFTNSKIAILYREKDNKIINVGPIAIDSSAAAKVSVKVINGSSKEGHAASVGGDIAGKLASLANVDQNYGDAKKKTYAKSVVVDVNKNKSDAAKQIANAIGGDVADLPAGEDKPSTDILVITGP